MDTMGRTIAKNAGVMMLSQLVTWVLALLLTLFLPRYLGPEGVGKFSLASSIWAVMSILLSFGMDVLQTKEISRNHERSSELLTTTLLLRGGFYGLCLIAVNVFARVVDYPQETINVINIIGIATLVWQISGAFGANLQAYERMEYMSLADILAKTFLTIISIVALLLGASVYIIAWIHMFAGLIAISVQIYGLRKITVIKPVIKKELFGWILKSSLPYMLVSGFLVAYNQIDVIIISLLVDETQIGWYAASNRLFTTFFFIPTVLIAAVFPVFSRLYKTDMVALKNLLSRSFNIILLTGIPIGLGLSTIANPLVKMLFGPDFANAGPILSVMGIVMIATYMNTLMGRFLISIDRQVVWTWIMLAAVVVKIPLDLVLVPLCQSYFGIGAMGGAFSYLITESTMMVAGVLFLPKGLLDKRTAVFAAKALLSGLIMAAAAWLVRGYFIAIPIALGGIVYVAAIFIFKVLSQDEISLLKDIFSKVILRIKKVRSQPAV
jgi:O-antigen/teichoic acid export membrane protein